MDYETLKIEICIWAEDYAAPFTANECCQHVKVVDDVKCISDALRKLFLDGRLVRKKIDNVRYQYCLTENAADDAGWIHAVVSGKNAEQVSEVLATPVIAQDKNPAQEIKATREPNPVTD